MLNTRYGKAYEVRSIDFSCGHKVDVPVMPPNEAEYWLSQTYNKVIPGAVASCPGCASGRHKKGIHQRVVGVVTRTETVEK